MAATQHVSAASASDSAHIKAFCYRSTGNGGQRTEMIYLSCKKVDKRRESTEDAREKMRSKRRSPVRCSSGAGGAGGQRVRRRDVEHFRLVQRDACFWHSLSQPVQKLFYPSPFVHRENAKWRVNFWILVGHRSSYPPSMGQANHPLAGPVCAQVQGGLGNHSCLWGWFLSPEAVRCAYLIQFSSSLRKTVQVFSDPQNPESSA